MLNPVLDCYVDGEEYVPISETHDYECDKETPSPWRSLQRAVGAMLRHHHHLVTLLVACVAVTMSGKFRMAVASGLAVTGILLGCLYSAVRFMNRRAAARLLQAEQRLFRLIGSLAGPIPPFQQPEKTDRYVPYLPHLHRLPSTSDLRHVEESVEANVQLIHKVDAALHHIRSATSLQYGLGTTCPSIDRIERAAAMGWQTRRKAQASRLSLASLRRVMAQILSTQLQATAVLVGMMDAELYKRQGLPSVSADLSHAPTMTLSWFRQNRRELARLLALVVGHVCNATKLGCWKEEFSHGLDSLHKQTLVNMAYLDGAMETLSPLDRAADPESPSAVKESLLSLANNLQTMQLLAVELHQQFDSWDASERSESWSLAERIWKEIEVAAADLTQALRSPCHQGANDEQEPRHKDGGLDFKGSITDPVGDCLGYSIQLHAIDAKAQFKRQASEWDEGSTLVYVGQGAAIPRTITTVDAEQPAGSQRPFRLDPAITGNLLEELKEHLLSLPKVNEVEKQRISHLQEASPESKDESDVTEDETLQKRSSIERAAFLDELFMALSNIGPSTSLGEILNQE